MAEPISIQQLKDASEDAITLADFIYKPANVMIPRRLAADINSLQYYLDYMSSYAQHSYETYDEMVANAANLPNGVSAFVTNDLDTNKNGIYTYNGVSFVKGDYQPEKAAKDYVDAKLGGLEVFDGKVRAQDVSTVDGGTQDVKNIEFRNELDALPFEGGVLADTFVTMTKNNVGTVPRNLRDVNSDTITARDFGVKGGFNADTLSDRFSSLADAKLQYPNATALTELADRVAFDAFLLELIARDHSGADWSCDLLLDKPLVSYIEAKSLLVNGVLRVKSNGSIIPYCFHNATPFSVFTGIFEVVGTKAVGDDISTCYITHGMVEGHASSLGLTGGAANSIVNFVFAENILGFAIYRGNGCHFAKTNMVRARFCGSANNHPTKYLQGIVDSFTAVATTGSEWNQRSKLTIPDMKLNQRMADIVGGMKVIIDNAPYEVMDIDVASGTIDVFPRLAESKTSGEILYVFGGALFVTGSDTAVSSVGTLQALMCGYGMRSNALYGTNVSSFVSEFNGEAIAISQRQSTALGNKFGLTYFEGNKVDISYGWGIDNYSALVIDQSIGLDMSKVWSMFAYADASGVRSYPHGRMGSGAIRYGNFMYSRKRGEFDIHSPQLGGVSLDGEYTQGKSIQIGFDPKVAELTGQYSKVFHIATPRHSETRITTLLAPAGFTINNSSEYQIKTGDYEGAVSVLLVQELNDSLTDIQVYLTGVRKVRKGATEARPLTPMLGDKYYDTTLLAAGKPIEFNGSVWVDALGVAV